MGKYVEEEWSYSTYNSLNRFENLDSLETKIINHLVNSTSKHADIFWKILKYDDLHALSKPPLDKQARLELINNDNGESKSKRLFLTPRNDDGQVDQCSSVYIYVENIQSYQAFGQWCKRKDFRLYQNRCYRWRWR